MSKLPPRDIQSSKIPFAAEEPDIGLLLQEIEGEETPQRLLDLAQKLQEALVERRRRIERADSVAKVD